MHTFANQNDLIPHRILLWTLWSRNNNSSSVSPHYRQEVLLLNPWYFPIIPLISLMTNQWIDLKFIEPYLVIKSIFFALFAVWSFKRLWCTDLHSLLHKSLLNTTKSTKSILHSINRIATAITTHRTHVKNHTLKQCNFSFIYLLWPCRAWDRFLQFNYTCIRAYVKMALRRTSALDSHSTDCLNADHINYPTELVFIWSLMFIDFE